MPLPWGGYPNLKKVKIGMRVRSTFGRIATDGGSGIIHRGTKFVPVE
jgi:uncharacterized protein